VKLGDLIFMFILYSSLNLYNKQCFNINLLRSIAPLETELLQLPVPGYGTVYRHISEMLTYHTVGSGGH